MELDLDDYHKTMMEMPIPTRKIFGATDLPDDKPTARSRRNANQDHRRKETSMAVRNPHQKKRKMKRNMTIRSIAHPQEIGKRGPPPMVLIPMKR